MACFLISAAEAAAAQAVKKAEEKKEGAEKSETAVSLGLPLSVRLAWLRNMLLGGAVLLLFEHIWHGEIVPWFPFLTAMQSPGDASAMLHEMATIGVGMAVLVTAVWFVVCKVADSLLSRQRNKGGAAL